MNNHFCSLGSELASGIQDTVFQPDDFLNRTDYFRPVNVGHIYNLISNLKSSKFVDWIIFLVDSQSFVVRISQTLYVFL